MREQRATTASIALGHVGFVWGVSIGALLTLVPLGVLAAYWFRSPGVLYTALFPQCFAMFIIIYCGRNSRPIIHHNKAVEATTNLIVMFLMGILVTFLSLPVVAYLGGSWIISMITGDRAWLDAADEGIQRVTGIDISEKSETSGSKKDSE